jgi:hypothetical protein
MTDFNTVEPQKKEFPLIPDGSIVKVRMGITYGGYGEDNALTHNEVTGSIGLKASFVVVDGEYKDRNIIQLIGFKGTKVNEEGKDIWGNSGKSLLRGLIESAKGISSKDTSMLSVAARKVSLKELDDMVCLVKVGVEKDKSGKYSDKNKIKYALTADHKEYGNYMTIPEKKEASTNTLSKDDLPDDEIPF